MPASTLAIAIGLGVVLGVVLAAAYAYYLRSKWGNLDNQRDNIIKEAERSAASMIKEAKIESKDIVFQAKQEAEKDFKERKNELTQLERTLRRKEDVLEKKTDQMEQRESDLSKREKSLSSKERTLDEKISEHDRIIKEQNLALERISGQTAEQARSELMRRVEEDASLEAARLSKRIEDEARETAEKKAVEIISNSIQRYSSDYISDAAVSSVSLPNDELKGRIIGREGRNIRALEAAAGVDLIVDDTPEVVTISAFDPVRREIARKALEKLISDGRIHPARIEELVEKAKKEVNAVILEEGEKAVFDVGLSGVHPELIKILGRLRYRTSYGQNVLDHSKEVAFLAGMMAGELGVDVKTAKRGGLLHDIGKAIDHEVEGSHVEIGVNVARKYGEKDKVINAINAHHGDVETTSVEAALVAASDALSAARPGVRRESIENYIKRLEALEKIANSFPGVDKSYAIQAGREIRIIVKPESVDDEASWKIAKELSKRIESEMTYPGQIKVTVIRESRYVEYAK
jgi:ribonuclease Y